jgi:hypothetical protein
MPIDSRPDRRLAQQRHPGPWLLCILFASLAHSLVAAEPQAGAEVLVKLSPQIRAAALDEARIAALSVHLIEPFLNDALIFESAALVDAPRIVATQEGRVWLSRGDLAYARGDFSQATEYRVFRNTRPLRDPITQEVLGYEAAYLGTAELTKATPMDTGQADQAPATLLIKAARQEIGVGDRLAPLTQRSFARYLPHEPTRPIEGRIVSLYGEGLNAGQNQIVALNRGQHDGLERGHLLALWQAGRSLALRGKASAEAVQLPDERHGVLFVFQVFERLSYALIISVRDPVKPGDRFSQP